MLYVLVLMTYRSLFSFHSFHQSMASDKSSATLTLPTGTPPAKTPRLQDRLMDIARSVLPGTTMAHVEFWHGWGCDCKGEHEIKTCSHWRIPHSQTFKIGTASPVGGGEQIPESGEYINDYNTLVYNFLCCVRVCVRVLVSCLCFCRPSQVQVVRVSLEYQYPGTMQYCWLL